MSIESLKPKTPLGICSVLFIVEFLSCFNLCANTRAVAEGNYPWTFITEVLFGIETFAVFKWMAEDAKCRTWWAGISGTLGGTAGSLLSIFITKHLY